MTEVINNQPKEMEQVGLNLISEPLPQQQENQRLTEKFANNELTLADLEEVLSMTIYKDSAVKIPLFLICTLGSTHEEQRNAILTGESSIGKTHNITEVLTYFRAGDPTKIIEICDASPRSFIHQANAVLVNGDTLEPIDMTKKPKQGDTKDAWDEWNELMRNSAYFLDFSHKIVVFLDIPNFKLLESLRSVLSHDREICKYLITDKNSKGMNKTKTVLIKGYFTALFASASSQIDEQEISRSFLLSPTDDEEKIRKAIELQGKKKTDPEFKKWYETEPRRVGLKSRIQTIEKSGIENILFKKEDMDNLQKWFFSKVGNLSPKAQRDFPRLYALAEGWALLNFKFRERTPDNTAIYANSADIEVAKKIYEPMLKCIELGLTPEEYDIWTIIEPKCSEIIGLRISQINDLIYAEKHRQCSDKRLREMLKNLCRAGLLREQKAGVIIEYCSVRPKTAMLTLLPLPLEKVNNSLFQP